MHGSRRSLPGDRPVEALGGAGGDEAVGVGEPREDAHLARVLELDACTRRSEQLLLVASTRTLRKRKKKLSGGFLRDAIVGDGLSLLSPASRV